jgi:hypothetical protein
MAKSLQEYAKENPVNKPEQEERSIRESAQSYRERQETIELVIEGKASILKQLEQGNSPQAVLIKAIEIIALLTNDEEWEDATMSLLESVYADLTQQSFLTDNAATAEQRLEDRASEYRQKLKKQLRRNITGNDRIGRLLEEALKAVCELEPDDPIL